MFHWGRDVGGAKPPYQHVGGGRSAMRNLNDQQGAWVHAGYANEGRNAARIVTSGGRGGAGEIRAVRIPDMPSLAGS